MSEETVVGAFRLLEQIGRGGMSVVWRAEHLDHGVPAAVKFVVGKPARDVDYRAQFRNEVERAVGLRHQGVVRLYDYGDSGPSGSAGIAEGTPYLAMEWASEGTLADLVPIATWGEVRDIVMEILDALGHAHSRGVVHRDLKPQNVLVGAGLRLMLADFGLAYRGGPGARAVDSVNASGGSARWMAPEQIRGGARDHGPWTDLYGVGCLVFWLLTYRPPYHSGSVDEILAAHLEAPIPRLKSRIAVPHDIESWLRRLLAKDPNDRYRYAADAAHDLVQFSDQISVPMDERELVNPQDVDTLPEDVLEAELFGEEPVGLDEPSSYALFETSAMPVRLEPRPLPPRGWTAAEPSEPSMAVVGAGLGLWGLRSVPLVDRDGERDTLWSALLQVHRTRRPATIVLRGSAGTGKTRLARWLAERAAATGAAHAMAATHNPLGGSQDGLAGALAAWFRAYGLDATATQGRIRTEFEALRHNDEHVDVLALAELVEVATAGTAVATMDSRERAWDALVRYLEPVTQDRPIVMAFDDVQWGADSLAFVTRVLRAACEVPVLFVLTVRDDALIERPVERARLAALLELDGSTELAIGALTQADDLELVTRSLHLAPQPAAEVASRSDGNPLFASQVTCDWIQRGVIDIDEAGFVMAEGASDLPDELTQIWASRLATFLGARPDGDVARDAIEIGAVLGHVISSAEWREVCGRADRTPPPDLVDALSRDGLIRRRVGGWCFCHSTLGEAIEAIAETEGRAEIWHSLCADQIAAALGPRPEAAERHAGHLVAGGRVEEALPRFLEAADLYARAGEFDRVARMFKGYDVALSRADREPTADRIRGDLHRVRHSLRNGSIAAMEPVLVAAEAEIARLGDPSLQAEALLVRSRLHRQQGDADAAVGPAEAALELLESAGDKGEPARARRLLADLCASLGRLDAATAHYAAAAAVFEEIGDERQLGRCEFGLAELAKQAGDEKAYVRHFEAAASSFENSGNYGALGRAYNEKAGWLRRHGRLEEALEIYGDSLRILPGNHAEVGIAQLRIGLICLARESWGLARDWLRRATESSERRGAQRPRLADFAEAVCAAGERRWAELEGLMDRVRAETSDADEDAAALLMQAGDLCSQAGEVHRSRELWQLARVQWGRLARQDELKLVDERLASLGG